MPTLAPNFKKISVTYTEIQDFNFSLPFEKGSFKQSMPTRREL